MFMRRLPIVVARFASIAASFFIPASSSSPLRCWDRLTGKSVKARYVERHEIAARCAEWEIIGSV